VPMLPPRQDHLFHRPSTIARCCSTCCICAAHAIANHPPIRCNPSATPIAPHFPRHRVSCNSPPHSRLLAPQNWASSAAPSRWRLVRHDYATLSGPSPLRLVHFATALGTLPQGGLSCASSRATPPPRLIARVTAIMGMEPTAASAALRPHQYHRAVSPITKQSLLFAHPAWCRNVHMSPRAEMALNLKGIQVVENFVSTVSRHGGNAHSGSRGSVMLG
jgi:hypothetical protein